MREVQSWIIRKKGRLDWYLYSLLGHNEYDLYDKRDLEMVLYAAQKTGSRVVKGKPAEPELAVLYFHGDACYTTHKRDAFIIAIKILHMYIRGMVRQTLFDMVVYLSFLLLLSAALALTPSPIFSLAS